MNPITRALLPLAAALTLAPSGLAASGVDEHTIALWLFDEPGYANVTLTDAGPLQVDLRLETGVGERLPEGWADGNRGLVPGRYGTALELPLGGDAGVSWPTGHWRRYGTAPLFTRGDEVPERCNVGYFDWTLELWLQATGEQQGPGTLLELRNESGEESPQCPVGFNAIRVDPGRSGFRLESRLLTKRDWDFELEIPTDAARIEDGEWHHLAFTYDADRRQLRHYVDGTLQPLPGTGGFLPLMGRIVSLRLGRGAGGLHELAGRIDEVRLSDTVRYEGDFEPPDSFSLNYGPAAPPPGRPSGPPLLFGSEAPDGPLPLGGRKHVFIDDALLERHEGLELTVNPPGPPDVTDFRNDQPWEATPRFGAAISDVSSIWDDGAELRLLYTNGGMWGGKPQGTGLAVSRDGLHWTKPELGLFDWEGSRENNIVLRNACQGTAFRDPNPDARPEHLYKYVAWCMNRGFYVFTSPDAVHWRRNESAALPFDGDGSVSAFWDDQVGVYRAFIRSLQDTGARRRSARAVIREILKPWPFDPAPAPKWDGNWALPKPTSGELPLVDTGGQVYRFKGIKYPWAPDVYLAFPWRFVQEDNVRPGSFLMVSRDGESWRRYEPPYYFPAGWELGGREVLEALTEQGLVRRGDEIWQYGTVRFTGHGGALYGGDELEGGIHDRLVRLTQRLDGFVSLDAGAAPGTALTKPLVFDGNRLLLNLAAGGEVRVAILDGSGAPIAGYGLDDCDPLRGDSTALEVTWRGGADVSSLAGRPVRLQLQLRDAKLYALQFVP